MLGSKKELLKQAIAELPHLDRQVLLMRYADGLRPTEIAMATGMQQPVIDRILRDNDYHVRAFMVNHKSPIGNRQSSNG